MRVYTCTSRGHCKLDVDYEWSFLDDQIIRVQVGHPKHDPLVGWIQTSNLSYSDPAGFHSVQTTGEFGIRMNAPEIQRIPEKGGVLVVGDSFTAGSEVNDGETFPAQLELLLSHPVLNAGVAGYGADQMVLWAEHLIPILKPSMVIVGVLDDDINRAGYRVYFGAHKPWFRVVDGELVHYNSPVPETHVRDWDTTPWWTKFSYVGLLTAKAIYPEALKDASSRPVISVENDPVAVSCALLARLKHKTDELGIPLLTVMLYAGIDRLSEMTYSIEKRRPKGVVECARTAGLDVLNTWSVFVDLNENNFDEYRKLYFHPTPEAYTHMTPAGNALVAKLIKQHLDDDGRSAMY